MTAGRRRASVVVVGIEGRVGRRRVVVMAWTLWGSVCALSLLLIVLTIAFHLLTRYDWYFGGSFQPWRMQTVEALGTLGAPILGALIVWRQPHNRYGWLWCVLGLAMAVRGAAFSYQIWAWYVAPVQPFGYEAAWLGTVMTALAFGLVPLVLVLFPDGRPPSPRWRPVVWATVVVAVTWTLSTALAPGKLIDGTPNPISWLWRYAMPAELTKWLASKLVWPVLLLTAVGALSLLARLRHARGRQRQQVKWLAYAAVPLTATLVPVLIWHPVGLVSVFSSWWNPVGLVSEFFWHPVGLVRAILIAIALWTVYIAIGIAVLRHHLYDIDRLINRTVVYGLLTVGGVAVYVAVVQLAEWLLREGVGFGGSLVATAVVAVGFAPARDRLQRWVDRRLYGERHDPVRAMARLGERLRDAPGGDVLAQVLQAVCETLRLPSASLRVEDGVEVAAYGRPGAASESIPLEHEGQRVGALLVSLRTGEQTLGAADRRVLEVLAAPVAVALHAVLLSQELQRSRERLVAAREEERRRLRRDLHDGLGPILTAVTLKADAARSVLAAAPDRADGLLAELRGDAKQAIGDLRRIIYDLRPAPLDELGLLGALGEQVDRFARQGLSVTLQAPPALPALPAAVEVAAYRIVTEALANVARHAHAGRATVTVSVDHGLCLDVQDDGTARTANGTGWRPGMGLVSMAERVAEVGGALHAGPTPTGGRVQASLPLELA
jgi:two-component system, NarL family, sensor kinase